MENKSSKIDRMIDKTLSNLNSIISTNTIIGKEIIASDGSVIIPISKITMGFLSGGGEYGDVKLLKYDDDYQFAGGSGSIVSVKPYGFLVSNGNGMKLIPAGNDAYERLIDVASSFLNSIKKND